MRRILRKKPYVADHYVFGSEWWYKKANDAEIIAVFQRKCRFPKCYSTHPAEPEQLVVH